MRYANKFRIRIINEYECYIFKNNIYWIICCKIAAKNSYVIPLSVRK